MTNLNITEAAIVAGWSNGWKAERIGRELGMTANAVRSAGWRLRQRIGAKSRAHAVAMWVR